MTVYAIIVAAGSGTRAGGELPKQYQTIGDKPVICHTVKALQAHGQIDKIIVVISDEHRALYQQALGNHNLSDPIIGGATRQQSVFNGLKAIADDKPDLVLIHDAARPFVTDQVIDNVIKGLGKHICTIPGIAVVDTINQVDGNIVSGRLDRDKLRAVQTPQGFVFSQIFTAHQNAAKSGNTNASDDSALVDEAFMVEGDAANIKLTSAQDIIEADRKMKQAQFADLADIRVGQGFDVHAFEDGDHVILCGTKIPFTSKLKGHSDADVAMHALTDAILGTVGAGDIGAHFPPTDPQWKGASSDIFLKGAVSEVTTRGGMIAHCDITIICEAPKLRPHIDAMAKNLSKIMGLSSSRVSIKATTSEQLGFTGRREGIAAMATATVRLPIGE